LIGFLTLSLLPSFQIAATYLKRNANLRCIPTCFPNAFYFGSLDFENNEVAVAVFMWAIS